MQQRFSASLIGDDASVNRILRIAGAAVPIFAAANSPAHPTGHSATALFRSPPPTKPTASPPAEQQEQTAAATSETKDNYDASCSSIDATPLVDVTIFASNGVDSVTCSLHGGRALHLCDVVILVVDSCSAASVAIAQEHAGRAGSDAAALPPGTPIVLLDVAANPQQSERNLRFSRGGFSDDDDGEGESASNSAAALNFAELLQDLETVIRYVGSAQLDPIVEAGAAAAPAAHSFYGKQQQQPPSAAALAPVIRLAANGVRSPRHVLWDGHSLTEVGRQALRRAFWILDQDSGDGLLDDAEISHWHRTMYGGFSSDDVSTMKAYARSTEDSYIAAGTVQARNRLITQEERVTVLGFLAVCHIMLAEGRHEPLWVMLGEQGIASDGKPYSHDEIEEAVSLSNPMYHPENAGAGDDDDNDEEAAERRARAGAQLMLHLSPAGISFFSSLYSRQRFAHPSDLFLFTPDCPWGDMYGLPNACEVDLPVHDFISCWRYMAVIEPATVAKFARYWTFSGNLATLFVACKMRPYRNVPSALSSSASQQIATGTSNTSRDAGVPPTAVFLVLGSASCGKTSLMQRIADNDSGTVFADDAHPSGRSAATATVRARINNDGDVLIALRELDESEVDTALADEAGFMNTICGVVFCFDTSDPFSLSYLARVYPRLAQCANLPIVLVMCKADLPVVDQIGLPEGPRDFCVSRGIMWPPVFTSLSHLRALPNGELLNDVDNLTFILAEVAVNPRLVEEMALAAQREGLMQQQQPSNGVFRLSSTSAFSPAGSNNGCEEGGGIGLLRAVKRATVVAVATIAAVKIGAAVWRRYHLGEKYPAVGSAAQQAQDAIAGAATSAQAWLLSASSRVSTASARAIELATSTASSSTSSSSSSAIAAAGNRAVNTRSSNEDVAAAAVGVAAAAVSTLTGTKNIDTKGGLSKSSGRSVTHGTAAQKNNSSNNISGGQKANNSNNSAAGPAERRREEHDLVFHMDKLTQFAEGQSRPAPEHHRQLTVPHAKRSWAKHGEWK